MRLPALPTMVDLMAVAGQLELRHPSSKLALAVRSAGRAQSCVADVTLAIATLQALAQLSESRGWAPAIQSTAAEDGLLANAIFLYARATAVSGKVGERGSTSIRSKLSSANQRTHDHIISIRNTALAHVRPNEAVSEELWHREIVFAVQTPDGTWLPAAMTRRIQANPALASDIRTLLPEAESELRKVYYRRIDYVAELLNVTPGAADLFDAHVIDPVDVFGSEQEARKALSTQGPGVHAAGVINR